MKRITKNSLIFLGVNSVLIMFCAFILFVPIINKEVIKQGSIYGFDIGMSKRLAYTHVQALYQVNEIEKFDTLSGINEENINYPEFSLVGNWQSIDKVKDIFKWFDLWIVSTAESGGIVFSMKFKNKVLTELITEVDYNDVLPSDINSGQSYSEVYSKLVNFINLNMDKNYLIRSGWMARRQVVEFTDEEYQWIERNHSFYIGLNRWIGNQSAILYFDNNDKLVEIVKRFQLMETYL